MAVSVRMEPLLEKELELAARLKGVTKSQFIIDAVERALGRKDPYQLLMQVREEFAEYAKQPREEPERAPFNQKVHDAYVAKHQRSLAEWRAPDANATDDPEVPA